MSQPHTQVDRRIVIPAYAIGAFTFLLFAGAGGWSLWAKMRLPQSHLQTMVKVEALLTLCEVQSRSRDKSPSRTWNLEGVYPCEEANRVAAGNRITKSHVFWRTVEAAYARVLYTTPRAEHEKTIRIGDLPGRSIKVGDEFSMFADPHDPTQIEKPVDRADYARFWTLTLVGAGAGLFVVWIGRAFGRRLSR